MMYKITRQISVAILCLVFSAVTYAEVIVNADSTTDTDQGLEFLHVNNTTSMTWASAQSGFSFDGADWELATMEQFLQLMEGATGVSMPDWNGTGFDVDFSISTQADAMMAALGEGADSEIPGFWVDGGSYGEVQIYAHTSCCNDFHVQLGSYRDPAPALFVRAAGPVAPPTPVPGLKLWGMILLTLLLIGLATTNLNRRNQI